jgi:hypothetical protein
MEPHQQSIVAPSARGVFRCHAKPLSCVLLAVPASIVLLVAVVCSAFRFKHLVQFAYAVSYEQQAPYRCLDRVQEVPPTVGVLPRQPDCINKQPMSRAEAIAGFDFLFRILYAALVLISCCFWYSFNL